MARYIKGAVINGSLNLRADATTSAQVVDVLEEGIELSIDLSFKNENWYSVIADGKTGYVMKNFIRPVKSAQQETKEN